MWWLTELNDWSALAVPGAIAVSAFVAGTILGLVLTGLLVVRMPADYFCRDRSQDYWANKHPVVRIAGRMLKNLLGALLILVGGGLSLPGIPGPGLLVILFGLTLLDFPGKRRLERWLIGRPAIHRAINSLRRRCGKPPIVLECKQSVNPHDHPSPTSRGGEPPCVCSFGAKTSS